MWTNRSAKNSCIRGLVVLALLAWAGPEVSAQTTVSREYQVKAVFLFNFAQFVDWPPDAFASPQAPLVIGVLGDDPFDGYLDETVRGEKVNNHPLVIQRYRWVEEIKSCHILFISQSASGRLEEILARLKSRNILTVSDAEDFARRGGMIRFVTENNKIRLRINVDAAKAAELTISSKLLRPARIVTTGKD
jgi:hypothetical protein